ncbi:ESF1 homolog [Perca fluviatilis]|uniref:ESF1 homolog n=1 Tax=Perca fluviatilis TaxID=8168 RepID=UPI001963DBE9|nr:ESF1 homolog [Perca fluviatilis]
MSSKKRAEGDERFQRVQKDPRFWEMPERDRKVTIDKRFQSMFHDKRFKEKYTVDKRGRPVNQTSTEDLKRFYQLSDDEDEEDEETKKEAAEGKRKKKVKEKLGKADEEEKKGKAAPSKGGKGEQPERVVRVVVEGDAEDDAEQQTAERDDVDLGDRVAVSSGEDEDDDDDDDDDDEEEESDVASGSGAEESGLDSEEEDSDSEPDLARGKGNVETSSDEDDEDDDVDAILRKEEEEIEHDWGGGKSAAPSARVSTRLAVCNMDWDRMKAKDLLALFNSFVPKGGAVLSVKIYPSEFGKERLKAEQTKGPLELRALPDDSEDDTEEEKGYRERMRDYQFKRLKYFYAVVECDSADTAAKIYQECDGFEYESSCSVLDLRFIPDDVEFEEEPKDAATDVNLSDYTPKLFTSAANATSKVQLTWDETDNERVTALNRNFNKDELLAMDFNAYLASSSEEEEEEGEEGRFEFGEPQSGEEDSTAEAKRPAESVVVEAEKRPQKEEEEEKRSKKKKSEEQISKYRELLKGIRDKETKLHEDRDMEMEVTWVPGLKETTEQLVKKKLEGKDKLTPWEDFLQKKKDRKKQKKSQRKEGEDEEDLSEDELPPDVDLSDPFFAEELAATDVQKKSKGGKKKKKKQEEEERTAEEEEELEKQKVRVVETCGSER